MKNKSAIVGLAQISIVEKRTTTNEDNGWLVGNMEWDIEVFIEKYWDFRKIPLLDYLSIFSYDTIMSIHKKKITQNSLLQYRETEPLYQYLHSHIVHIIQNIIPNYSYY